MREHDLEDVAGQDVFLCHIDRSAVEVFAHRRRDRRQRVVVLRRLDQGLIERSGAVAGDRLEPVDGLVVAGVDLRVGGIGRHQDVRDQRDPLPPMVVGRDLTDDRHDRVGRTDRIGRYVRKMFNLAHDVVAQIADNTAV